MAWRDQWRQKANKQTRLKRDHFDFLSLSVPSKGERSPTAAVLWSLAVICERDAKNKRIAPDTPARQMGQVTGFLCLRASMVI